MSKLIRWVPIVVILVAGGVFVSRRNTPPNYEVIHPKKQRVIRSLAVTGQVEAVASANISTQINGILVKRVLVDKGDRVQRGQALIELDDRELRASVARANAQVKQAEANLLRVKSQSLGADRSVALTNQNLRDSTELKSQRDTMATNLKTATERLTQSKEVLAKTREGARREAVRASQAQLRRAESQLRWNALVLKRATELLKQGATSQADYDLAKVNFETAQESAKAAKEELAQLSEPRSEDVRQAEASVREAEASVRGAEVMLRNAETAYRNRTNLRLNVTSAQTEREMGRAAVLASEADLLRARADLEQAQSQLSRTLLLSPVDGLVTERLVEAGETVSPGRTLLSIVEPKNLRVRADVDEMNLHELKAGLQARIIPDAYPDMKIEGAIDEIVPTANSERGTVELRLKLKTVPPQLLPRLTVSVNIIAHEYEQGLTLPRDSVLDPDSDPRLRYFEAGEVKEKPITIQTGEVGQVVILKGATEGDWVIVRPLSAKIGQKADMVPAKEEPKR